MTAHPAVAVIGDITTKLVDTLRARAALVGVVLHVIDDDHGQPLFVASKWSMTRQMTTFAEVDHFLKAIGGPKA